LNQKYFQIGVSSELSENLYDLNRGERRRRRRGEGKGGGHVGGGGYS
jgi:hypothetical protein